MFLYFVEQAVCAYYMIWTAVFHEATSFCSFKVFNVSVLYLQTYCSMITLVHCNTTGNSWVSLPRPGLWCGFLLNVYYIAIEKNAPMGKYRRSLSVFEQNVLKERDLFRTGYSQSSTPARLRSSLVWHWHSINFMHVNSKASGSPLVGKYSISIPFLQVFMPFFPFPYPKIKEKSTAYLRACSSCNVKSTWCQVN